MNFGKNVVGEIVKLLPPPPIPDSISRKETDATLGDSMALPDDYVEFMESYGPGSINVQFKNSKPFLGWILKLLDVSHYGFDTTGYNAGFQYDPDGHLPSYPSLPGVLLWGFWEPGFNLYWEIQDHFQPWTISVWTRGDFPERYSCTFSEYFLYNILQQPSSIAFSTLLVYEATHIAYCPESKKSNPDTYFAEHPELVVEFPIKPNT